jgi:hypothetical protein
VEGVRPVCSLRYTLISRPGTRRTFRFPRFDPYGERTRAAPVSARHGRRDGAATGRLASCAAGEAPSPATREEFLRTPLASWIETTFGIVEKDGRLVRATPRSIGGESAGPAGRFPLSRPRDGKAGLRLSPAPVHQPGRHGLRHAGGAGGAAGGAAGPAVRAQRPWPHPPSLDLLPGVRPGVLLGPRCPAGGRVFADRDPSDRLEEEGKDLGSSSWAR